MTVVLSGTAEIRKAVPADAAAVASALAVAFIDDPVFCWMLPDDDVRPVATRTFFDIVVDILAPHDDAWTTRVGSAAPRCGYRPGGRRCRFSVPNSSPTSSPACARRTLTGRWS